MSKRMTEERWAHIIECRDTEPAADFFEDSGFITELIDEAEALRIQLAEAQAVIAKLPMTADGVVIMPGMIIWWVDGLAVSATDSGLRSKHEPVFQERGWNSEKVYSTCEAATAATENK